MTFSLRFFVLPSKPQKPWNSLPIHAIIPHHIYDHWIIGPDCSWKGECLGYQMKGSALYALCPSPGRHILCPTTTHQTTETPEQPSHKHNHSCTTSVTTGVLALTAHGESRGPAYTQRSPKTISVSTRGIDLLAPGGSQRPYLHKLEEEGPSEV